jgi:hypothetical protein
MKKYKNKIILGAILITVFVLGFLTNSMFNKVNTTTYVNETEVLISNYNKLPFAIDSIENLSVSYNDTANIEMLHYVLQYANEEELPDYYITKFGDTIEYNKENFFYYVSMYVVAENLMETRKHIINGLLLNIELEKESKIRKKVEE